MLKNKKIIIAGDSWGCGVWGWDYDPDPDWFSFYKQVKGSGWPENPPKFSNRNELPIEIQKEIENCGVVNEFTLPKKNTNFGLSKIIHLGLQQFFTDIGYEVINLSIPGSSNKHTIQKIKEFVTISNDEFVILWIQTDALRDLRPYKNFKETFQTYDQIIDWQRNQLYETYKELNSFKRKIICLGGVSKIHLDLIRDFNNLDPVIPSIIEWLIPNFTAAALNFSDWTDLIGRQFSITDLDRLVYAKKIQDAVYDYPDVFYPDSVHPNLKAHKMIFDFLVKHENL